MPAGTIVSSGSLVSPGGQQGIPGPNAVSTDAGNQATFGSDSRIYVPDPTPVITSVRLRGFNAVGNPTFEVDQRCVGGGVVNANGFVQDRWATIKGGTMVVNSGQNNAAANEVLVPGTSFRITRNFLRVTLTTAQASLGTSDYLQVWQQVEGPSWRELQYDVHSLSFLVRCSVAGLSFGVVLRDPPTPTRSLAKLFTIPTANTWTLITLPNLPIWPSGNFNAAPGVMAYTVTFILAAGSSMISPANDTWQTGNFQGALGQSNFAAQAVNSTFDIAFVQHEPGAQCTTLIDCPFSQNYDDCLRYYCKSYDYATKPGTVTSNGAPCFAPQVIANFTTLLSSFSFPKRMAKVPTVTGYSTATGNPNWVRDLANAAERQISSVTSPGESGFGGFTLFSVVATGTPWYNFHYTADTGW